MSIFKAVLVILQFTLAIHSQDVQIVTYWGQNSAYGENSRREKDLVDLCQKDSPFDVINVGFVQKYFDEINTDRTPGLNFDGHCKTPIDGSHRSLFSCPNIENGIRACQENGKKILIAIGGPRGTGRFDGDGQAEKFAENIWNIFLGGHETPDLRPFSSIACDGVNLLIAGGSSTGYSAFIRHLYYLTKRDQTRKYIITATPSCNFPDSVLGPAPSKALETSVKYINHLYVRFYGANCGVADNSLFDQSLNNWLNFAKRMMARFQTAPLIFVGIPALERATPVPGCYQSTRNLREIYKRYRENKYFGGFMVWDASWDASNFQYGKTFSERLYITIKNTEEQEAENFDENEEEEMPIEPAPTEPTTPLTLQTRYTTVPTPAVVTQTFPTTLAATAPAITEAPVPPPTPPPPPPVEEPPEEPEEQEESEDNPEENPYEDDDDMNEGDQEPEETPEQVAAKDPDDMEEDNQQEDQDQEEDPYQPRPPDMENRVPVNEPESVNDGKAYQEASIPFSQAAKLLAAAAEEKMRHNQWLRRKAKQQLTNTDVTLQNNGPTSTVNQLQESSQNPNFRPNNQSSNPYPNYPVLTQAAKYPFMPNGYFTKLTRKYKTKFHANRQFTAQDESLDTFASGETTLSGSGFSSHGLSGSGLSSHDQSGSGSGSASISVSGSGQ